MPKRAGASAYVGPVVVKQALSISGGRIKEPRLLPTEMSSDGKLMVRIQQRESWLQLLVYGQNRPDGHSKKLMEQVLSRLRLA